MTICLIQMKVRVAKFPASAKLQTAGSLWTNSLYITADSPILSNTIYILIFFLGKNIFKIVIAHCYRHSFLTGNHFCKWCIHSDYKKKKKQFQLLIKEFFISVHLSQFFFNKCPIHMYGPWTDFLWVKSLSIRYHLFI